MGAIGGGCGSWGLPSSSGTAHVAHGTRVQGQEGEGGLRIGIGDWGGDDASQWGSVRIHPLLHVIIKEPLTLRFI